jgi:hypothetical protein
MLRSRSVAIYIPANVMGDAISRGIFLRKKLKFIKKQI